MITKKCILFIAGFLVFAEASANTIVNVNTNNWYMKSSQGGTSVITQETDGVKFTPGNIWRSNALFINDQTHDFSDASIYFKFMANGGGQFMDANIGLIYDDQPDQAQVGIGILGSRYTMGNVYSSYLLTDNQWYYAHLRITPDQNYTIYLYENGFPDAPDAQLLNTQTGTVTEDAWTYIHDSRIFVSIGDNRYPGADQWYKLGEVSYEQAIPDLEIETAVMIKFQSESGNTYYIEKSIDLESWTNAVIDIEGDGELKKFFFEATSPQIFFRLKATDL